MATPMHFPLPFSTRERDFTEPPALVRVVGRGDVQWNRPVFKAPPLEVKPPAAATAPFSANERPAISRPASK